MPMSVESMFLELLDIVHILLFEIQKRYLEYPELSELCYPET